MSTLTKVLIVLLTIASIFLCGIVVTYVSNANNYRQMYNDLRDDKLAAEEKAKQAENASEEAINAKNALERKLNDEINALNIKVKTLDTELANAERKATEAIAQQNNWRDINLKFLETNDELRDELQKTLTELKKVDIERMQVDKELEERTATLDEKMAIIFDLDKQLKQLIEEKIDLLQWWVLIGTMVIERVDGLKKLKRAFVEPEDAGFTLVGLTIFILMLLQIKDK